MTDAPMQPESETPLTLYASPANTVVDRPGCVTAYAVLLGIAAVFLVLGGWIGGSTLMSEGDDEIGLLIIVAGTIGAVLYFAIARGLWQMRNWARVLVMVVAGLGIAGNLITMCVSITGNAAGVGIISGLISVVVGGIIFFWFYDNAYLFA